MSKRTLYFDGFCGYVISAATEDGKLVEFKFEKEGETSITGNLYKGRVENVLPGMNAAFVNCGLERNCYLSFEDCLPDPSKYDGENSSSPILPELFEGEEILVQVVKPPIGKKGAKVTPFPTFVGRSIIYMPLTPFVGVSRKICDNELRKSLMFSAERMRNKDEGIVFRTAAPYVRRDYIEYELASLRKVFSEIEGRFKDAAVGDLLFADWSLPRRVLRDTILYDLDKICVGNKEFFDLFEETLNKGSHGYNIDIVLSDTGGDMFSDLGLGEQILSLISPTVPLENGGNIVIDACEALTVIDVNTGKFTGDDNLEQTVYYTNISAAREIARQVSLRNIGGIVVVDFIDMANAAHKKSLLEELERALSKDSAKYTIAPMSKFGLVEFTRKRMGQSVLSALTERCSHCHTGYVRTPRCAAFALRGEILKLYARGEKRIRVDTSPRLFDELTSFYILKNDLISRMADAEIFINPRQSFADDGYSLSVGNFTLPKTAIRYI